MAENHRSERKRIRDEQVSDALEKLETKRIKTDTVKEPGQCLHELRGIHSYKYMGKFSWDTFYKLAPENGEPGKRHTTENMSAADELLRNHGYGQEPYNYPGIKVATEKQARAEEILAQEAGRLVICLWREIRECLSRPDCPAGLENLLLRTNLVDRQLIFNGLALELQRDLRLSPKAYNLNLSSTNSAPNIPYLGAWHRPDYRAWLGNCQVSTKIGAEYNGTLHTISVPKYREDMSTFIKLHPAGDEEKLHPLELALMAPALNKGLLLNPDLLMPFISNRALHHPALFAARDFDSSYIARANARIIPRYHVQEYLVFSERSDVPYPSPFPVAHFSSPNEDDGEDNTEKPAGEHSLRHWQNRGRAYSHLEGRTVVLTQLYIYGLLWKLLRRATNQETKLVIQRSPNPDDPVPYLHMAPDQHAGQWSLPFGVKDAMDYITHKWHDMRKSAGHPPDANGPLRIRKYGAPTVVNLERWEALFENNRDSAAEHLWRLTSDPNYFRKQAQIEIDHHYGQIRPITEARLKQLLENDPDYAVTLATTKYPPVARHFQTDKVSSFKKNPAKELNDELAEEITKRIVWCAIRDLEGWESLYHTTALLREGLESSNVDLEDPKTQLVGSHRSLWLMVQRCAREMFGHMIREICPRLTILASPHFRDLVFRIVNQTRDDGGQDLEVFHQDVSYSQYDGLWRTDSYLGNILKVAKDKGESGSKREIEEASADTKRATLADMMMARLFNQREYFSRLGFDTLTEETFKDFRLLHDKGIITNLGYDVIGAIYQLSRFVGEMEETRRMCPREIKRSMVDHSDESALPFQKFLHSIQKEYELPKNVVPGPKSAGKFLGQLLDPVLDVLDTADAAKKAKLLKVFTDDDAKIKKPDTNALEKVWARIFSGMTGLRVENFPDYGKDKNVQGVLGALRDRKIGPALCKFLLGYHEHKATYDGAPDVVLDKEEEKAASAPDPAPTQADVDTADEVATGAGDCEMKDMTEQEEEEEAGGSNATQPNKRVRPQSKYQKNQKQQAIANHGRRGGGRGGGVGQRGPLPVVNKKKLDTKHWDTFAGLFGKKGKIMWSDICKAMGAIGYEITPDAAGGSPTTFARTLSCNIPSDPTRRRTTVIHRIHARDDGSSPGAVRRIGRRLTAVLGISPGTLRRYYTGEPNGGWQ